LEEKKEKKIKEEKERKVLSSKAEKSSPKKQKPEPKKESKKEPNKEQKSTFEEQLAWKVIKEPHITEKATLLQEEGKYVFKVFPRVNKIQVKRAIEELYKVKVEKVRIINVHPKKRIRGRVEGKKPGYKKAIVSLAKGHKIEILPR